MEFLQPEFYLDHRKHKRICAVGAPMIEVLAELPLELVLIYSVYLT